MKFLVTGDKMVMINGKIVTIKSGEFETECKTACEVLLNVNGIKPEELEELEEPEGKKQAKAKDKKA